MKDAQSREVDYEHHDGQRPRRWRHVIFDARFGPFPKRRLEQSVAVTY